MFTNSGLGLVVIYNTFIMVLGLVVLGQACISVSIFKDMKSDNYSVYLFYQILVN